jgi:DNA-binding HxlR family transcriptional regulator
MADPSRDPNFDSSRAELFDSLGHPLRIKILQALETGPLGFGDLKRKVGIESNGNLQYHLGRLEGLVKASADGTYALTDEGREALRVVGGTERVTGGSEARGSPYRKRGEKRRHAIFLTLGVIAVIGVLMVAQGFQMINHMQVHVLSETQSASFVLTPGGIHILGGGQGPASTGAVRISYAIIGPQGAAFQVQGVEENQSQEFLNTTLFTLSDLMGDITVSFPENLVSVTYGVVNLSPDNITVTAAYLEISTSHYPDRTNGTLLAVSGSTVLFLETAYILWMAVTSRRSASAMSD